MKKEVIWGTGIYGGRFSKSFEADDIAFFIDQDKKKEGERFFGKKIMNPAHISEEEWGSMYVYIPLNYYSEISEFLDSKGLKEDSDYSSYGHKLYISQKRADADEKRYLTELDRISEQREIPVFGTYWKKHGYNNYFYNLNNTYEKYVLISEVAASIKDSKIKIQGLDAPLFADYETFIDVEDGEINIKYEEVEEVDIEEMARHINGYFPEKSFKACKYNAWRQYKYIRDTLDIIKCTKVLAFSSVTVGHSILQNICEKRGIKAIYTHPGMIHGTLAFDAVGEVGESVPAIYVKEFRELDVTEEEINKASEVRDYLKRSRLNRKVQPHNSKLNDIELLYPGKPVILFAGQNDVGSSMVPYNERAKNYFSPIFSSSIEAAVYLAELCEKNQWNFIFKPHPMYVHSEDVKQLPRSVHYIDYADINDVIDMSDVVVTILSTANYDATVRDKPVVALGYNWAKGKGFNYEAFEKDKIEQQIKKALTDGLTEEMNYNFLVHIAQSLKYYLYDNGEVKELRYGQKFPDSFDDFFNLYNMLKD